MGTLDGRRPLVTGGGQGVGRGIVRALAAEGAGVALMGRTEAKLAAVAREVRELAGSAVIVVGDVTVADDVARTVDGSGTGLGGLDILVNNAQVPALGALLSIADEETSPASEHRAVTHPDEHRRSLQSIPLRRLGDPIEDIGRAVAMLCAPSAQFITGTTVALDGGQAYLR